MLDLGDDRLSGPKAHWASGVGIAFFVLVGVVIAIWSVWASSDLLARLRSGVPTRTGLIGAAGLHVAASAAALLAPLVLTVTLPVLALVAAAYLLTRPTPGTGAIAAG
ncbi:hypothetical protein [Embleya sp. NBC_00896]|uniref:hypothetical protein n=1 Tax=Embleya sp. NBC_00896 TaxID=2975961 RepID=UPI003867B9AE|nr:hypothetical protein OG928_11490 [Embleya sp. NBC_00896]